MVLGTKILRPLDQERQFQKENKMTTNKTKPTAQDVAQRALALQLIVDRGWSDYTIQTQSWFRRLRVRSVRKRILAWDKREHISHWVTPEEKKVWDQPFGELSKVDREFATWRLEAIVPLAWAIGLRPELPEFSAHVEDKHYGCLRFCKRTPVKTILATQGLDPYTDRLLRTPEAIELQANVYLLHSWRAKELLNGNKKRVDLLEAAPRIFGEWITDALALLPLNRNGELVMERYRLVIPELRKRELVMVQNVFEGRLRAFKWLSGENPDWDQVTTDT